MTKFQKTAIFLLRVVLGFFFFYAGFSKLVNPEWTAAGYLATAKTFPVFYAWLASGSAIGVVNFLNAWGLTLIGASLVFGFLVRISSIFGMLIMTLYYLPILNFPYVDHGFLIDQHIIYVFVLLFFVSIGAGKFGGVDQWIYASKWAKAHKKMRKIFG